MASDGSAAAVYNARLRRVVFSSREQHENDLRWAVFARNNGALARGKWASKGEPPAVAADQERGSQDSSSSCYYVGMDSRDSKRAIAQQRHIDAALRSVIDLPCLQQY